MITEIKYHAIKENVCCGKRLLICYFGLVTLRGPSAKSFWESLERLNEKLEDLGYMGEEKL